MIEGIIFDVGGVLQSFDYSLMKARIREGLEISKEQFEQYWNPLTILLETGLIDEEEYWRRFQRLTGSRASLPSESLLDLGYRESFKVNEDSLRVVRKLRIEGYPLAVLSNCVPSHALVNKEMGVYKYFSAVCHSFEIGSRKPSLQSYRAPLERMGLLASEGLMIDDRMENVLGAKKAGLEAVHFQTAKLLRKDLEKFGIRI